MNFRQLFTLFLPFLEPLQAATTARVLTSVDLIRGSETITHASPGYGRDEIPVSERHVGLLSNDIKYFFDLSSQYSNPPRPRVTIDKMVLEVFLDEIDILISRLIMLKSGMILNPKFSKKDRYDDKIKFLENFRKSLIIAQKKDSENTDSLPPIAPNPWG